MKIKTDEIVEIEEISCNEVFCDLHTETENYIAEGIVTHNSKPSKKSISVGTYFPDVLKEKVEVVVVVDVSGSIGQKELTDFLSEVVSMARAYQERIDMTILQHETEVIDKTEITNGNISKILNLKIKGGGGTSHIQPFKFIQENIRDCKAVVFLTDGYSDLESINFEEYPFEKIFVISKGGYDSPLKNKRCHIIKLED